MSWFAVDDRLPAHRQVQRMRRLHAGDYLAAVGLWTLSRDWAASDAQGNYDRVVPLDVLTRSSVQPTSNGCPMTLARTHTAGKR